MSAFFSVHTRRKDGRKEDIEGLETLIGLDGRFLSLIHGNNDDTFESTHKQINGIQSHFLS